MCVIFHISFEGNRQATTFYLSAKFCKGYITAFWGNMDKRNITTETIKNENSGANEEDYYVFRAVA